MGHAPQRRAVRGRHDPATGRLTRPGIRIHRPRTLPPDEVTTRDGIPVTTPARTILDMAALLTPSRLEHLLDQAEIRELTDYPALDAIARAHPGHPGAAGLRRTLRRYEADVSLSRSDLEILFRDLCRTHALPQPLRNATVAGKEVDFLFPAQRLIVETDSWRYHAFENDRAPRRPYQPSGLPDAALHRPPARAPAR